MIRRVRGLTEGILAFVGGLAALELVLFWGFVVRARFALGFWPSPYQPDPKELGFSLHRGAVVFVWLAILGVAVLTPVWGGGIAIAGKRPPWWLAAGVAALVALLAMTMVGDPGHFIEWFLD